MKFVAPPLRAALKGKLWNLGITDSLTDWKYHWLTDWLKGELQDLGISGTNSLTDWLTDGLKKALRDTAPTSR